MFNYQYIWLTFCNKCIFQWLAQIHNNNVAPWVFNSIESSSLLYQVETKTNWKWYNVPVMVVDTKVVHSEQRKRIQYGSINYCEAPVKAQ